MKRLAILGLVALAPLGGCFHEHALDRHLYENTPNFAGTAVPPMGPQAPVLVTEAPPVPALRDPAAPDTSIPASPTAPVAPS